MELNPEKKTQELNKMVTLLAAQKCRRRVHKLMDCEGEVKKRVQEIDVNTHAYSQNSMFKKKRNAWAPGWLSC